MDRTYLRNEEGYDVAHFVVVQISGRYWYWITRRTGVSHIEGQGPYDTHEQAESAALHELEPS